MSDSSADLEHTAIMINDWDNRMLPGLLQTPGYTHAYLRAAGRARDDEQIDQEVALRMARQEVLPKLLAAWLVIDESVLCRPYDGRTVMRDQLIKLEQTAKLANVFIQVMPYSSAGHPGAEGPLRVMEYRDSPAIWYTEGCYSGRMTDARDEVAVAMTNFNIIRASALPPDESASFIATIRSSRYE